MKIKDKLINSQYENHIGVVGAGLIGLSWAGLFSAFGYQTTVYDPYLTKPKKALKAIDDIWASLDLLFENLNNKKLYENYKAFRWKLKTLITWTLKNILERITDHSRIFYYTNLLYITLPIVK